MFGSKGYFYDIRPYFFLLFHWTSSAPSELQLNNTVPEPPAAAHVIATEHSLVQSLFRGAGGLESFIPVQDSVCVCDVVCD